MGIISIKNIGPGMKITEAVRNYQGHILLPPGTALTEKHIKLLKTWGVVEVSVEGFEEKKTDSREFLDDALRKEIERAIEEKFPYGELDPVNSELKRVTVNALAKHHPVSSRTSKH